MVTAQELTLIAGDRSSCSAHSSSSLDRQSSLIVPEMELPVNQCPMFKGRLQLHQTCMYEGRNV